MAGLRKLAQDVTESRRQAVLGLLHNLFGTDELQGQRKLDIKRRGTNGSGRVQAAGTRAGNL